MSDDVYRQRVQDVMSRDVVTIDARGVVQDALDLILENRVAALPVVDQHGRCVGILSTSDFMDVTQEVGEAFGVADRHSEIWWNRFIESLSQQVGQRSIMDMMTETVVSVRPDAPLVEAAEAMLREKVHRLPVVDQDRRLLGIVSTTDVLRAFVRCAPKH